MSRPFELLSLSVAESAEEDKQTLVPYDHTKLSAINVCPTWGILRYSLHKTTGGANRELPLEAGTASHDAFAAMNMWYAAIQNTVEPDLVCSELERIFGLERSQRLASTQSPTASDRTNLLNYCLEALYSSGYYDDPSDKMRTVANISEGIISFCDQYDPTKYVLWHSDKQIGVECIFDQVATLRYVKTISGITNEFEKRIRITGKLDALKYRVNRELRLGIHEYKTGYRIDNAWLAQWILSHQITGYCIAATTFTGLQCTDAQVTGMQIPIGRDPLAGVKTEDVHRNTLMITKWAEWLVHTVEIDETYRDYILDAPRYTHSCNRYFRSCSMLPFCDARTREEQMEVLESMTHAEWSPLEE